MTPVKIKKLVVPFVHTFQFVRLGLLVKGGNAKEKRKKSFPENPDFLDPDPNFRIYVHGVAMGAERATCSQNFRPLAAIVPEIVPSLTIIKYRMF